MLTLCIKAVDSTSFISIISPQSLCVNLSYCTLRAWHITRIKKKKVLITRSLLFLYEDVLTQQNDIIG